MEYVEDVAQFGAGDAGFDASEFTVVLAPGDLFFVLIAAGCEASTDVDERLGTFVVVAASEGTNEPVIADTVNNDVV